MPKKSTANKQLKAAKAHLKKINIKPLQTKEEILASNLEKHRQETINKKVQEMHEENVKYFPIDLTNTTFLQVNDVLKNVQDEEAKLKELKKLDNQINFAINLLNNMVDSKEKANAYENAEAIKLNLTELINNNTNEAKAFFIK